jgi:hypothetical protein
MGCRPVAVVITHVYTSKNRKSLGLPEKHAVATGRLGNHLRIRFWTEGNQEKPVPRWPVAGPSGY